MPYVAVAGAELYYEEHGQGDPLMLVHGFTGAGEAWWAGVHPAFADRYRVIVPDLRAHGRSAGAPGTLRHEHSATDLVALLDHLDVERAHFVGHSFGAVSLLFLGTRQLDRVRTLALVGGTHTWNPEYVAYAHQLVGSWGTDPAWIDRQRQRHDLAPGEDRWRGMLDRMATLHDDPDARLFAPAELAAIACPVLVLHGDRDPFFPLEIATTMYRSIPNAELAILPAAGHGPLFERRDLFIRMLADFLGRHATA